MRNFWRQMTLADVNERAAAEAERARAARAERASRLPEYRDELLRERAARAAAHDALVRHQGYAWPPLAEPHPEGWCPYDEQQWFLDVVRGRRLLDERAVTYRRSRLHLVQDGEAESPPFDEDAFLVRNLEEAATGLKGRRGSPTPRRPGPAG
ncbi:hypothetical protein [Actinocorallia longicatena]|uniref:Uncharacterized protein n=1 Tax=Actinocorallia longicatena TaxID=111803 RepID=A0ABP6Q6K7_9ACTN